MTLNIIDTANNNNIDTINNNNWHNIYNGVSTNQYNNVSIETNEKLKKITLLDQSLTKYTVKIGVINCNGTAIGVFMDNNQTNIIRDKVAYIIKSNKSIKSNKIIKPIFTKENYLLLEFDDDVFSKCNVSRNHLQCINEYIINLYKYISLNKLDIKFKIFSSLADKLYPCMFNVNNKISSKIREIQKIVDNILKFEIKAEPMHRFVEHKETKMYTLQTYINRIMYLIDNLNEEEKLFIALFFEITFQSNYFKSQKIDNKVYLLKNILTINNTYWNCCSIFDIANGMLKDLELFNIVKEKNNNTEDLLKIINRFDNNIDNKLLIKLMPIYSINKNEGKIKKVVISKDSNNIHTEFINESLKPQNNNWCYSL